MAALLPRLQRFARSLVREDSLADDLVQTALERALIHRHRWRSGTRLDSWLYRILQNAWFDERRRRRTRGTPVDLEDHMAVEDGERLVADRLLLAQVIVFVAALPAEQRTVIRHIAFEGLSYRETASAMRTSIGTVMSRCARARQRLHAAVGDSTAA